MVEKEADETRVIYWYHRRFIEVANEVYVSKLGGEERESVFSNVIDFFNETWKDKPKPFKYNQRIKKKKNLATDESEASRNTTTQPTEYIAEDGIVRYNKRKLTELPGFISQLTANLCIPLACKHIYFNYEFSHGQFTCCKYEDIIESLQKISQISSYSISEEAKKSLRELKFVNFLYLQCIISINDHPDSIAIQILSRTLMFYGDLDNLSEFINQSDKNSAKHCALVASYQSLQPPGIGPLFTLEKHTKPIYCTVMGGENFAFIFTLSNKINVFNIQKVTGIGELELPRLNEPEHYKQMLVYFAVDIEDRGINLKLINGAVVVISDHFIYSVNCDSTVNFTKTFDNATINKTYQISTNHILVFFENTKYFEVYNFHTGEMILSRTFEIAIKFIETNLIVDKIYKKDSFLKVRIMIILQNSEIHIFDVTGELDTNDRKLNGLKLDIIIALKSPGIDCIACANTAQKDDDKSFIDDSYFILSFKDGSILNVDIIYPSIGEKTVTGIYLKPKLNQSYKFLDAAFSRLLLLGENQFIYFMDASNKEMTRLSKIAGVYNDGRVIKENMVCGVSKGLIDFYQLSIEKKGDGDFKCIYLMQIDAHFMDLTKVFCKGNVFFSV
jgi:hypothetical protein